MTATEEETGSSEGDFYFLHHQYAAPSEGVGATDGRADAGRERRRHKATFKSHLLLTVCAARPLVKPARDRERKRGGLSRTNERANEPNALSSREAARSLLLLLARPGACQVSAVFGSARSALPLIRCP